ncbi:hypothetical protein Gpo141_00013000, partial [Globisporangium polare]
MAIPVPSTRQICEYFFIVVLDDHDEPTSHYRCQCTTIRKQDPRTGYSNLLSHLTKRHPGYVSIMAAAGTGTGTLVEFTDTKSRAVHGWIDWVVTCNLLFSFPEDPTVRKYAPIFTETLLKYTGLVTRQVEDEIADTLSGKFGIAFDGWTFKSEHYLAVHAVLPRDTSAEMAPCIGEDVVDHT